MKPAVDSIQGSRPATGYVGSLLAAAGAAILTILFVVGHVPYILDTVDGLDSTNFILAVDHYDPAAHQPHPPGFPVHVALGRVVGAVRGVFETSHSGHGHAAAAGLRLWSVISGALAVCTVSWVAVGLGASAPQAVLIAALTGACPLFWLTATRPLSDMPGLWFSLLSQALALAALRRSAAGDDGRTPARIDGEGHLDYRLAAAALVAGIAAGLRVQTTLLTLPLLAVVTLLCARRRGTVVIGQVAAVLLLGVLSWAVPLLSAVGGPGEYARLLSVVAADDVSGVEMVATNPTPRLIMSALLRTFVAPWGSDWLGWWALGMSVIGFVVMARHQRSTLSLVLVMLLPYLAFHLLLQETASIRYALPLVPVVCLLIVAPLTRRSMRMGAVAAMVVLLASSSVVSVRATSAYGRNGSPVTRALSDVRRNAALRSRPAALAYHHAVGRTIRDEPWPGHVLPAPVRYEWLELARYWLDGGRETISFLADSRRTDLDLIDPRSRRLAGSYRWSEYAESLLGGIQPASVKWYELSPPGWFLMRGWSITPETHGVARRDGYSASTTGLAGYVARRDDAAVMIIGGRNLGGPCDTGAQIDITVDGRLVATRPVSPQSSFLEVISLEPGRLSGQGDYAALTVTARDAGGAARLVDVAIEQFDVQSAGGTVAAFDRGWHMPEFDPTGRRWRWTDQTADFYADGFGQDLELVIRGESPLRYFRTPPEVIVRAGIVRLATFRPDADFEWVVPIPSAALAKNGGRITLESEHWFIPNEVTGNGDRRRLALRIYSAEIRVAQVHAKP